MINVEEEKKIILDFKHKGIGSSEAQIFFLTNKINYLQKHFLQHKKDNHGRRGLLLMVAKRRKILNYLKRKNNNNYLRIIEHLELRK